MALTVTQMIRRIKDRTKHTNDSLIVGELNAAQGWAYNRLYNSENGPDQLESIANEITLNARTRTYDLGASITGTLYGIKLLWLRFSSETVFSPMRPVDSADLRFIFNDQWTASDTTTVAAGHPVMYDVINFSQVRFAPPIPSGSVIRADVWLLPPILDPNISADNTLVYGSNIVQPVHEAIVAKATGLVFDDMDDARANTWETRAESWLQQALFVVNKRSQGPVTTQPFRIRRKRWI